MKLDGDVLEDWQEDGGCGGVADHLVEDVGHEEEEGEYCPGGQV